MNHLISYKLFESNSELTGFIDYLKHDLQDDGLDIRQSSSSEFLRAKWKNTLSSNLKERNDDKKFYKDKEVEVFEIVSDLHKKRGLLFSAAFNLYDVEPHVKRLLEYAKDLGYNHFEVRKITQMSRNSKDVTQSFIGKGRLPESAKKEILILQILIMGIRI